MENKVKFYRCETCGNIVALIENGGGTLVCCGHPMKELVAGTSDGAVEKHVPVIREEEDKIYVNVGAVDHPMLEEHYIEWIALVSDKTCNIHFLKPGEKPSTTFHKQEKYTIYEYCNLHGLWKKEQ